MNYLKIKLISNQKIKLMKKQLLVLVILAININLFAQESLLVANRTIEASKKSAVILNYAFNKGDRVTMTFSTKKDKPLDAIVVSQSSKNLYIKQNVNPSEKIEFTVPVKGIVGFRFEGSSNNQDVDLNITRLPVEFDGKYFNTALTQYKKYDTIYAEYEIDSVVGYEEIKMPKKFEIIESADYESVKISENKYKIKGGGDRMLLVTKPKSIEKTPKKEMKFLGYQFIITSAAGADKMWKYIGVGVDVACLGMQLLLPAGGTVASLGVETAFEMIGPQEGGEPVYYAIMGSEGEYKKFAANNSYRSFESGLATGYNGSWTPQDTLVIGLKNLNIAVEIEVSVAAYAVYQATTWTEIAQDIVTIKPKTIKVKKNRQIISNKKHWDVQL